MIGAGYYCLRLVSHTYKLTHSPEQKVIIAYNKAYEKDAGNILAAYKSVLQEEGVPYETIEISRLIASSPKTFPNSNPAIILPDGLLKSMPEGTANWIQRYLDCGGNLLAVYDPGVQTPHGYFLEKATLAEIVGINYMTYKTLGEKAYTQGYIRFKSENEAAFFQIPPGKINDSNLLTGYAYGSLSYPFAMTEILKPSPETSILADAVTENGDGCPAITIKKYTKGTALFVDLPLGYLKAYSSDDLPLRAFIRTFLFTIVKIPHLLNSAQGKGALVVNWHIDSSVEWTKIPEAISNKYLRNDLRYSIHITAGDFSDMEGDGLGFDACGKAADVAKSLLNYGIIGSHGGWAHNWFADNLKNNRLSEDDTGLYIRKNKTCLEGLTRYPILEYSAPAGVYPQPMNTELLERLGFNSYYYTGDMASSPNRAFYNGKMISSQVIAFPVQSLKKSASLFEMSQKGIPEKEVQSWLTGLVDYIIENRTTRLFYSHIYDIDNYPQAILAFLDYASQKQREGRLNVAPMSEIAGFFQKFLKTMYSFQKIDNRLSVVLKNEAGLSGITFALPRDKYLMGRDSGVTLTEDKNYYYLTVNEDVKEKTFIFDCR